jgi:hypothetical protein
VDKVNATAIIKDEEAQIVAGIRFNKMRERFALNPISDESWFPTGKGLGEFSPQVRWWSTMIVNKMLPLYLASIWIAVQM